MNIFFPPLSSRAAEAAKHRLDSHKEPELLYQKVKCPSKPPNQIECNLTSFKYKSTSKFSAYIDNRLTDWWGYLGVITWNLCCSYNSINMDGTLMRKAMHADPENYVTSMTPGQYWTWGTHMRGVKGKSPNTINQHHILVTQIMTAELFLRIICLSELFTGAQIHAGVYWFDILTFFLFVVEQTSTCVVSLLVLIAICQKVLK